MTEREFICWLNGYLCDNTMQHLNRGQVSRIKKMLSNIDPDDLDKKYLDKAIEGLEEDYEEEIDLYKTYGGD
jgi:hypothetical protein